MYVVDGGHGMICAWRMRVHVPVPVHVHVHVPWRATWKTIALRSCTSAPQYRGLRGCHPHHRTPPRSAQRPAQAPHACSLGIGGGACSIGACSSSAGHACGGGGGAGYDGSGDGDGDGDGDAPELRSCAELP